MKRELCLFTASPEPSGVGEHMLTLAAELRGQYRISFVCPPRPAALPFLERARALGLETLPQEVRSAPETRKPLVAWLRDRAVAILHCHAGIGWEGHDGVYAARAAGVPAIVRTEHLPDLITKPRQRNAYNRMVQAVDRLICVSEEARDSFLRTGVPAEKLVVVRNGIHPRSARADRAGVRARLGVPSDARIVLTVGRMTEQKGYGYLLEAVPTLVTQEPRAHVLIVGTGPLAPRLRAQMRRLKLHGDVTFLGRRDDVPDLLAAADLFVLPSLFEGLPLVALEAMAAGLPVVGTRVCGTSEAVADGVTGRLVEPGNAMALAQAIVEVLAQPGLAARLGYAGRRRVVEQFSAARMARETAAVYEEVLGAGAGIGGEGLL